MLETGANFLLVITLVASAVLPERKSYQRRLILKELLRD